MTDQVSIEEKIAAVEAAIVEHRSDRNGSDEERRQLAALKAVAADLRARLPGAPREAAVRLQQRLDAFRKTGGYGASRGVAEELIGRWPVVRQALEQFAQNDGEGR